MSHLGVLSHRTPALKPLGCGLPQDVKRGVAHMSVTELRSGRQGAVDVGRRDSARLKSLRHERVLHDRCAVAGQHDEQGEPERTDHHESHIRKALHRLLFPRSRITFSSNSSDPG